MLVVAKQLDRHNGDYGAEVFRSTSRNRKNNIRLVKGLRVISRDNHSHTILSFRQLFVRWLGMDPFLEAFLKKIFLGDTIYDYGILIAHMFK